jgi:ferredoxin-type protein NapH
MRQAIRRALVVVSFLSFPVVMNFLSPYVIIAGASQGAVSGSFLFFGFLFVSSLAVGRAFCGWACPAGGLQECLGMARGRRVKRGNWTKWLLWAPWAALVALSAVASGGLKRVDPLFLTESGISVSAPGNYVVYFSVIGVIVALSLAVGKRSFCHHLCWMAPFMIAETRLARWLRLPSLRLEARPDLCSRCGTCAKYCPMSLEVQAMVEKSDMRNDECILCGGCVDGCPKNAIAYAFTAWR